MARPRVARRTSKSDERERSAPSIYSRRVPAARSGTRDIPDLLDLSTRITNYLGYRAVAMQVCPYLFHVGLAGIRRHVDDKTDLWKWHLDFFLQLRAATVESRFGINGHGLKLDAVFLRAFMTDDVGAGDQCGHNRFGRCRPHVGAIALSGFIDDRPDVAYGNLCARVA